MNAAEQVITTHVLGPIRLIAAFVEHLQAQPAATIWVAPGSMMITGER